MTKQTAGFMTILLVVIGALGVPRPSAFHLEPVDADAASVSQATALPDPGVHVETRSGTVAITQTWSGTAVAGLPSSRNASMTFPIPSVDRVPAVSDIAAFLVNIPTVQDAAAAAAQMRFAVGDHVREPDYQVMTVLVGKFRIGIYRFSSPQLTPDWLSSAYAKLSNTRTWRDKHPPAIVGLILNGEMYPVRIDEAALTNR